MKISNLYGYLFLNFNRKKQIPFCEKPLIKFCKISRPIILTSLPIPKYHLDTIFDQKLPSIS